VDLGDDPRLRDVPFIVDRQEGRETVSDLDVQRYRVALEREQKEPHAVACGLLGVPADAWDRFLVLAPCLSRDTEPLRFEVRDVGAFQARPATGVWGDGAGGELWQGLHAFPVTTVYEQVGLLRLLNTRGQACTLWDKHSGSRASADGFAYLKVEDGWRTPRDRAGRGFRPEFEHHYDAIRGDIAARIERVTPLKMLPPPEGTMRPWKAPKKPKKP
jgi:hypothetical protein